MFEFVFYHNMEYTENRHSKCFNHCTILLTKREQHFDTLITKYYSLNNMFKMYITTHTYIKNSLLILNTKSLH